MADEWTSTRPWVSAYAHCLYTSKLNDTLTPRQEPGHTQGWPQRSNSRKWPNFWKSPLLPHKTWNTPPTQNYPPLQKLTTPILPCSSCLLTRPTLYLWSVYPPPIDLFSLYCGLLLNSFLLEAKNPRLVAETQTRPAMRPSSLFPASPSFHANDRRHILQNSNI